MARLNGIVSGMLRDLVESRVAADSLSRQQAEIYWADPVLTQFPVPRFAIKEASIKLRFAIDDIAVANVPVDPAVVKKAWAQEVLVAILPNALKAARLDADASSALLKKLENASAQIDVVALIAGKANAAAAAAVKWVLNARAALPPGTREKLKLASVRGSVAAELKTASVAFMPRVKQIIASDAALKSHLDIAIKRADLAQVPDSQVHEITLTFSTDDLQPGGQPGPAGNDGKRG